MTERNCRVDYYLNIIIFVTQIPKEGVEDHLPAGPMTIQKGHASQDPELAKWARRPPTVQSDGKTVKGLV